MGEKITVSAKTLDEALASAAVSAAVTHRTLKELQCLRSA